MKKTLLILGFISFTLFPHVRASNAVFFNFDEKLIETAFYDLTQVENYLLEHEGLTYSELIFNNNFSISFQDGFNVEPPLGIPSFVWGLAGGCMGACIGGLGATALVYVLTDQNKDEARKAAFGCATSNAMWVLLYGAYIVFIVTLTY